ncbi:uncharacterized protein LOC117583515 [Drosophila guanche]|uniref:Kazal-like domain-containing protein n=1 Tax=Drosophila guanche TaxID=7266 RepID=A0A3B0JE62_DROGU|nr:uncharacterized protein LOC117583515 [Drosophila guanche]SPP80664.1 Hypothetical predicted protein [Drosophila guanche]
MSIIAFGNKILVLCVFLAGIGVGPLCAFTGPKKCHDVCPMKYRVVCALNALDGCLRTFASSCVMRMYNCKYQKDYRILSERACEIITHDELNNLLGTGPLLEK